MDRVDRLTIKAKELTEPKLKPYERAMQRNPYIGRQRDALLELLTEPLDDWQMVAQALAWMGGG